jgi:hypothetical protein
MVPRKPFRHARIYLVGRSGVEPLPLGTILQTVYQNR